MRHSFPTRRSSDLIPNPLPIDQLDRPRRRQNLARRPARGRLPRSGHLQRSSRPSPPLLLLHPSLPQLLHPSPPQAATAPNHPPPPPLPTNKPPLPQLLYPSPPQAAAPPTIHRGRRSQPSTATAPNRPTTAAAATNHQSPSTGPQAAANHCRRRRTPELKPRLTRFLPEQASSPSTKSRVRLLHMPLKQQTAVGLLSSEQAPTPQAPEAADLTLALLSSEQLCLLNIDIAASCTSFD